jgi:hypothetical protein
LRARWGIGEWRYRERLPLVAHPRGKFVSDSKRVDFCRGPAELAAAIRENRPCRLSTGLAIHIVELVEALQYPQRFGGKRRILSNFTPAELGVLAHG